MSLAGTLDGPITQSKLKSANTRGQVVIVRDKLVPPEVGPMTGVTCAKRKRNSGSSGGPDSISIGSIGIASSEVGAVSLPTNWRSKVECDHSCPFKDT